MYSQGCTQKRQAHIREQLQSGAKEKKTWPESVCEGLSDEGYSDRGSEQ